MVILPLLLFALNAGAQSQSNPAPSSPGQSTKKQPAAPQSTSKSQADQVPAESQSSALDPDTELQLAVRGAGNDNAALVKNLQDYLSKYPDSPHRAAIYRTLLDSEMQRHDTKAALDYAEKAIAIQPEDSQSMFMAVTILEKMPDDASQVHAIDYDTRLLDRVSKADPESRPQQMTLDEWQAGRNKFLMDLYVLRGRMQHHLHKNQEAVKDLTAGYRLTPNANAALTLGEIAEEEKHADEAVRQYATAFMLVGQEQQDEDDPALNRESLRSRMGNLWRFSHDSNTGLGDILLSSYDNSRDLANAQKPDATAYNKDVTDPLQFSLRRIDGNGSIKMADSRGKVVVLDFWTTWCAYCNTMEPLLSGIRTKFVDRSDVVFLTVNADEDEALVAPFLRDQKRDDKSTGTLVFADGINKPLHVEAIPTVLILDKAGKIAYRTQGFAPDGFADLAIAAITKASGATGP